MTDPIVIFCDQVRHEVGNKFSIMGIYDERVVVESNISMIPQLTVFIRLSSKDILEKKLNVRIKFLENNITADHLTMQPISTTSKHVNLAFNISPIPVVENGEVEVFLREGDAETRIATLAIVSEDEHRSEKK
jgi:hypothetical protein